MAELIVAYWKHAQGYYVKNGQPTDEVAGIKIALRFLKQFPPATGTTAQRCWVFPPVPHVPRV